MELGNLKVPLVIFLEQKLAFQEMTIFLKESVDSFLWFLFLNSQSPHHPDYSPLLLQCLFPCGANSLYVLT